MREPRHQLRHRRRLLRLALAITALGACAILAITTQTSGANGAGSLQADVPRDDTPVATNGRAYAGAQVGNRILVGGTFTLVEPSPGATAVSQPYLYVFDADTGQLDPNQFAFDDRVNVILPADEPDHVFVGGKFNTINGETKRKLAKLDLSTGTVVSSFTAQTDGAVTDLALSNGVLYATGGFTAVNADPAVGLAAIDPTSGAVDTSFDIPLTNYIGQVSGSIGQRIAVTPDGATLVVMHRARYVDGQERRGVAMVDLTTTPASLSPWHTAFWENTSVVSIVDGEVSPDGSYLVVVGGWGDSPPWRDTAIAFPVSGGANTDTLWVTRNHDSTFAVGIDDEAVYIGGHFCWTEGPDTAEPWGNPAPSGKCPNKVRRDPTSVYRDTFAALDPATGKAIEYAPYTDANNGIRSIEVIPRGLLVGGDQTWTHDIRTGRAAFFDQLDARENHALDGTATQSSTGDGDADLAVDGLREGQWFTGTVTATQSESQPWWQVELNESIDVSSVEIWNRTDCCTDRLSDVWVFVSDAPFASDDPDVLAADPAVEHQFLAGEAGRQTIVDFSSTARYVRVQLDGNDILSLAEVQVYAGDVSAPTATIASPVEDEELTMPATLSGTATDDIGVAAVEVQVRNRDTGDWLRSDGTWGAWQLLTASIDAPGSPNVNWTFDIAAAPAGARYKVSVRAVDNADNTHAWVERRFTVGSDDVVAPTVGIDAPSTDETLPGAGFSATGTAGDAFGVASVKISIRDRDTGQWLQADGTFGAWVQHDAALDTPNGTNTGWTFAADLPAGCSCRIYATSVDTSGNSSDTVDVRFFTS